MNEASSRYVDRFATERLLKDKLGLVHHAPDPRGAEPAASFDGLSQLPPWPAGVEETREGRRGRLCFPSAIATGHPNNDLVQCRCQYAADPRGSVVFVHGLYEDNLQLYDFFISLLNEQALDVYLLFLPYHYGRTPPSSRFSGELFWSADIHRSALAYQQAVYDLSQLVSFVRHHTGRPVAIAGFSMGGGIALSLAARIPLDRVFAINPVCNMSELVWDSVLFAPIRQDLEAHGVDLPALRAHYSSLEPLNAHPIATSPQHVVLAHSLYDEINDPANYDLLAQRWQLARVLSYKAGHLNILRVPKLPMDLASFVMEAVADELL
jgi:pimeloyl-ACP methyl ester carboxylesterase